jgi:N-dimethylarginine dimethylaminohydrolase
MKCTTPSELKTPTFLMNFPLSVSNKEPNNDWMDPKVQGTYDLGKAYRQWLKLYKYLAQRGIVYLLPGKGDLQDLPFVANLGCYLPHLADLNVMLLSYYTSKPRKGEEEVGKRFFESFDYMVRQSPYPWEGEADLKWLRDNIYIGGVGSRSSREAFRWMRERFNMGIIEVEIDDPKLYHLDCLLFPLSEDKLLVNSSALNDYSLQQLKGIAEVIEVPEAYIYESWTNCVLLGKTVLYAPYRLPWHEYADLLDKHGFGLETFDLSEFDKSGADLSCLVMHMNYRNK